MSATNESSCSDAVSNLAESSIMDSHPVAHELHRNHGQLYQDELMKKTSSSTGQAKQHQHHTAANSTTLPQPTVYGELSILGYNGYIPNVERNGRRNRSKFLLCMRPEANGIRKSRHYIVKQPQDTKAILDKEKHSISFTFSRSQAIIVEYVQDETTDMFQIGRSSEDPIDFVVMDTLTTNIDYSSQINAHHSSSKQRIQGNLNENSSSNQHQQLVASDLMVGLNRQLQRHLAKVGDEVLHHPARGGVIPTQGAHDSRHRQMQYHRNQHQQQQAHQAVLLNYPQPNISNLPPVMADHFRGHQDPASPFYHNHLHHQIAHSSGANSQQQHLPGRGSINNSNDHPLDVEHCPNRHNIICKQQRSHATQSTISRFACRIIVERKPPYTARIYAAGFDSSKNIFLGEKATKWEQYDTIDGLTTNGILLMHPKRGLFNSDSTNYQKKLETHIDQLHPKESVNCNTRVSGDIVQKRCVNLENCLSEEPNEILNVDGSSESNKNINTSEDKTKRLESPLRQNNINDTTTHSENIGSQSIGLNQNDSNNNNNSEFKSGSQQQQNSTAGGVWREVSVDGGIYAIRESRSAAKKGTRIESESNILQDGTLIDLCGATLLWRSLEGFRASPTKKSLEEKIDMLNASRPQCPVGLNTLVIPRKPILPNNQHHRSGHHKSSDHRHHLYNHKDHSDKNSHQPYVYLKCGHVQGYHDWGATEKSDQRTCPICLSVGMVAKLSMGLEPSFYVDSGPLTHVFNPCGHMASDKTVRYWCSVKIPHGTHFFHSICPFCATPLATNEPGFTRLIFQDDLD